MDTNVMGGEPDQVMEAEECKIVRCATTGSIILFIRTTAVGVTASIKSIIWPRTVELEEHILPITEVSASTFKSLINKLKPEKGGDTAKEEKKETGGE